MACKTEQQLGLKERDVTTPSDRTLATYAATIGCSATFLCWTQLGWHSWTVYVGAITLPCIAWALAERLK